MSVVLFSGFNILPENHRDGWVHDFPYWVAKNIPNFHCYHVAFNGKEVVAYKLNASGPVKIPWQSVPLSYLVVNRSYPKRRSDIIRRLEAQAQRVLLPVGHVGGDLSYYDRVIEASEYEKPVAGSLSGLLRPPDNGRGREQSLLYPGHISPRKNQLLFTLRLSARVMEGRKLYFAGKIQNEYQEYAQYCFRILKIKGINFEYLGQLAPEELVEWYRIVKGICLYSWQDLNPRVLNESLACNCPFLISRNIIIPPEKEVVGRRISWWRFNKSLNSFLTHDFGQDPYRYYQHYARPEFAYKRLWQLIEQPL